MRRLAIFLALLALALPLLAVADSISDDGSRAAFIGWLDDDTWLVARAGRLWKVAALTGHEKQFAGFAESENGISAFVEESLAERAEAILQAQRTQTSEHTLLALGQPIFGPTALQVINQIAQAKDLSVKSPDGKWVAANRKNNLYLVDPVTKKEQQLTFDGSDVIFNGRADAVYQEEIFYPGRSLNAYWWSPDSSHLAFMRLDDTNVPRFTIIDQTQRTQKPEVTTYPKAGATNPIVKLGIARMNGEVTWVYLGNYDPKDLIISRVGWTPDSKYVYFYAQNRTQTWLDVCLASRDTGECKKLFRDQTKAWIHDNGAIGPLNFLKDGSFLFFSARTGNKHVYHYAADGKLLAAVTSGDWDAQKLNRVDEEGGWVYFNTNKDVWLGSVQFRAKLDGTGLEAVTKSSSARRIRGTHEVYFSPSGRMFVDEWSDFETPPQIVLHQADGEPIRAVQVAVQEPAKQNKVELVKITTPDGITLAGTVLLPPNLDKSKKHPVWFSTYGGPHMPTIRDANVGGGKGGGDQAKANQGYIVFHADPRSSSTTPRLAWACYKQLGVQELKDVETAIQWLISTYPFVDAQRIGISGHSYGGFLTAFALTHSKMFAAGIAGAPPTDWRNYNSIYTDRYMTTPEENPEGYEATSVVDAAKNVHGRLLILHGMMDDNVHMTSAIQLVDALQKANRDFEVMLYPHARHGIGGAHYQRIQNDFMKRVLQP